MTLVYLAALLVVGFALVYFFAPKGWRTIAANVVAVLPIAADALVALAADPMFVDILPAEIAPLYTVSVILANVYLRTVTTTPLGRRE